MEFGSNFDENPREKYISNNPDRHMHPELVVLTGVPGSGKSTLAKKKFPHHKRINLDTLKSRSLEILEISRALKNGEDVVIDNTNTTVKSRLRYLDIAKSLGIPVRSIYLKSPLEIALKRNNMRSGKERVPDFVVKLYFRRIEPPQIDEGFDSVVVIDMEGS